MRSRWAAAGAAVALLAAGLMPASASLDTGQRPAFVPITPCRLVDTRPTETVGPRSAPIGANETYTALVRGVNGNCNIPSDAVGVIMNVAAVFPTGNSFLTVFPSDAEKPLAANVNWIAGQPPVSNAVTADLSADGKVSFYNLAGTVHITADIVGYFVDHTHDDRYYTEAEVDAALAGKENKPSGTQYLNLDPIAFQPVLATQEYDYSTGGDELRAGPSIGLFAAPVQLPEGATVTGIVFRGFDNNAAPGQGIIATLLRNSLGHNGFQEMARTPSTDGAPGAVTQTDNSIDFATIDNANNSYLVRIFYVQSNILILYGVTIGYTLP